MRKRRRGGARGGALSLLKATSWLSLCRCPFSPLLFFFLARQSCSFLAHGAPPHAGTPTTPPSFISSSLLSGVGSGSHALLHSFQFKVKWCAPRVTSFHSLLFSRWAVIYFAAHWMSSTLERVPHRTHPPFPTAPNAAKGRGNTRSLLLLSFPTMRCNLVCFTNYNVSEQQCICSTAEHEGMKMSTMF